MWFRLIECLLQVPSMTEASISSHLTFHPDIRKPEEEVEDEDDSKAAMVSSSKKLKTIHERREWLVVSKIICHL